MGQYFRNDFSAGWQPSADAFNAPKNALLRADNLVLDERGTLALRQGSAKINTAAFSDTDVHSLATFILNNTKLRMTGCTNAVYANGTSIATSVTGTGDTSFGSHMGEVLFSRGTTHKKYDGLTTRNWGFAAPSGAPTLGVVPSDFKTFASCDSTETPVMTSNEGTQTFAVDRFGVANHSVQIAPDSSTHRGMSTKTFTAPQDFTTYNAGGTGSDRDLVDFYVYATDPSTMNSVTLMIDVNTGDFQNDWYEYTFVAGDAIQVAQTPEEVLASNYTVEGVDRDRLLAVLDSSNQQTLDSAVTAILGWNHFQVPRGTMIRHGLTTGKDWATVMAVRVIVNASTGGSGAAVRFDEIKIIGAGGLTGKYAVRVVAANDNGTYVALSGPSPISNEAIFAAQSATVSIDGPTVAALDSQVTALWVYIMGGRLNAFYRAATGSVSGATGAFDYTSPFEASQFTSIEGIANFTSGFEVDYGGTIGPKSHNYSWEAPYLVITDPVTISITDSEIDILAADLRLETDNTTPPDDIIGIEGPHFDRTLCLTADFIYPSRELDPDAFSTAEVIRVGDAVETALWIKKVEDSNVYVGTTRDIYRFDGDWTPQPDGSINVIKRPMHVANPPISSAVCSGEVNGTNLLIYLSGTGWTVLGAGPLTSNAVDLLWRGYTRHDVSPVNITDTTARFKAAISKNVLFAITPENPDTTSSATLHAYHFATQRWYRFTYPQAFRSLISEYDGTLIAGDLSGFLRVLDLATKQDDGVDIPVDLRTPIDDNGEPFTYKDPENMWLRCDTGTNTATIAFHTNGSAVASATHTTAQEQTDVLNADVTDCPEFSQLQLRVTGDFNTFVLRQWGLRYIDNPVPQVIHDTGPIDLSQDAVKWVRRLRIKAKTPVDLTVQPYWDGATATTRTITVGTDVATVYEVPLGREDFGRVGRVVITSSDPSHIYWCEFQFNGSGAQNQKRFVFQPEAM